MPPATKQVLLSARTPEEPQVPDTEVMGRPFPGYRTQKMERGMDGQTEEGKEGWRGKGRERGKVEGVLCRDHEALSHRPGRRCTISQAKQGGEYRAAKSRVE